MVDRYSFPGILTIKEESRDRQNFENPRDSGFSRLPVVEWCLRRAWGAALDIERVDMKNEQSFQYMCSQLNDVSLELVCMIVSFALTMQRRFNENAAPKAQ